MAKPARSDEVSLDTSKTSAPADVVPKASVAPAGPGAVETTTPAPPPPKPKTKEETLTSRLERESARAHHGGDFEVQALLAEIAVAAGTLRQKTGAARGKLKGEIGALIDELHNAL